MLGTSPHSLRISKTHLVDRNEKNTMRGASMLPIGRISCGFSKHISYQAALSFSPAFDQWHYVNFLGYFLEFSNAILL
jgi:hypothetical protein